LLQFFVLTEKGVGLFGPEVVNFFWSVGRIQYLGCS
jgi:hypothetical protein